MTTTPTTRPPHRAQSITVLCLLVAGGLTLWGMPTPAEAQTSGFVGFGTATPQTRIHVVGDATVTGTVLAGNVAAKYQDVAEWVPASRPISAGTVLVLDPKHTNHVQAATSAYDTRVAGVVSESPGIILGEEGTGKVRVATTGRVKVKVDATARPIHVGDLLVTSSKEGVAMSSEALEINGRQFHQPGTILGKAVEPLPTGEGEILVLLSLQ